MTILQIIINIECPWKQNLLLLRYHWLLPYIKISLFFLIPYFHLFTMFFFLHKLWKIDVIKTETQSSLPLERHIYIWIHHSAVCYLFGLIPHILPVFFSSFVTVQDCFGLPFLLFPWQGASLKVCALQNESFTVIVITVNVKQILKI